MKKHYLLVVVCFLCFSAFAQIDTSGTVDFLKLKNSKKLVFIELQLSDYNKVKVKKIRSYSSLTNKETATFLSQNFRCFRISIGDSLTSFLFKKQLPKILPAYYIFDADSNLLHSSFGVNKLVKDFELMRDSALEKAKKLSHLKFYKDKLAQNTITKKELKDFIGLKLQLKQYDNGELIEKFATEMDEADTENSEILLLIMRAGPFYSGLASKKAVTHKELYNAIYKKEYSNYSPRFDKRALTNSIAYATETRNLKMIQNVARSYQYRYNKNDYDKEIYSPWVMMNYYRSTKDTSNFLIYLCKYYDKYLLVTPDSSKKYEAKLAEKRKNEMVKSGVKNGSIVTVGSKDYFPDRLYYGANQIVKYHIRDPFYLNKGINYCRHTLLLSPHFYRAKATLAQLLYLSGFSAEAEKLQREVINTPNISEALRSKYRSDLEKIRYLNVE
ncbi:hypothetical protein [Pedobacter arcticus]|uniref:hypothetical protein n=1 Tax=Pedobacter arcticus TaxID=752140 RepID=UPI0003774F80|nr:hypothetical protein [Pedobacter arcticus]